MMQVNETTVDWNAVALVATWIVCRPSSITLLAAPYKFGGFLHTDLMRQRPFITKDGLPFLEVLDRCRDFMCTIDKDRVFALLQHTAARLLPARKDLEVATRVLHPLHTDTDQRAPHFGLKVDYNVTLFDLYRQIVLGSIYEARSLQVLSHAIQDAKYREDYPTWMPLWHASGSRFTGPRRTFLYNAGRDYRPQICIFKDSKLLGPGWFEVGTITRTSTKITLSESKVLQGSVIGQEATPTNIREISRLIVHDCWQPEDNWLQEAVCRTSSQALCISKTSVLSSPKGYRRFQANYPVAAWKVA
jgi:hypothetical protein